MALALNSNREYMALVVKQFRTSAPSIRAQHERMMAEIQHSEVSRVLRAHDARKGA